ncbi:DUF1566 domain-containing protein [candidate division KSB1 bacterium]|nr:DUF1566 domain-containing protein [candidate division KSB1 bacterium]
MLESITAILIAIFSGILTLTVAIIGTRKKTDALLEYLKKHRLRIIIILLVSLIIVIGLLFLAHAYLRNDESNNLSAQEIKEIYAKIFQLDTKIDTLQKSNQFFKTRLDSVDKLIGEKQNRKEEIDQQINQKETEKSRLNAQLQNKDPRNVEQDNALKLKIAQLESEIQKLTREREQLEKDIEKLKAEKKDLNQKNEDLKNSLVNSNHERQELELRLKKEHDIFATRMAQSDSIISLLSTKQDQSRLTHQIAWSPDKKWLAILYSDGKISRLLVFDVSLRTGILDSLIQKNYQHLKFSTDGDKIFLNSDIINLRKQFPTTRRVAYFRSQPKTLSYDEVESMLKKYDFFDCIKNSTGRGFANQYKLEVIQGDKVVFDQASGLMWQQGGSDNWLDQNQMHSYIDSLKKVGYAGFYDWRLPTLEEAMSLMEPKEMNEDLHIDPVFDKTQRWIWTADAFTGAARWWVVDFYDGCCNEYDVLNGYVRLVRSGHSLSGR